MSKIAYIERNFRSASLELIQKSNGIINDYTQQGYNLTLRQLYYQLVSRDIIPNNPRSYDNLGAIINDARLAGLIDWDAIEDRTRNLRGLSHWSTPKSILKSAAYSFKMDKWKGQPEYCEVWVEKEALAEIVQKASNKFDVSYFSCRGYVSQSEMWSAAQRLISKLDDGAENVHIIHLGDHDPSGIDMTRDIFNRLCMFMEYEGLSHRLDINRIALTMSQIQAYNPPPNPAKISDSRYEEYQQKFGNESWELDALEPKVLEDLICSTLEKYIDEDLYGAILAQEIEYICRLKQIAEEFND